MDPCDCTNPAMPPLKIDVRLLMFIDCDKMLREIAMRNKADALGDRCVAELERLSTRRKPTSP